jgi:hypothetical protein
MFQVLIIMLIKFQVCVPEDEGHMILDNIINYWPSNRVSNSKGLNLQVEIYLSYLHYHFYYDVWLLIRDVSVAHAGVNKVL